MSTLPARDGVVDLFPGGAGGVADGIGELIALRPNEPVVSKGYMANTASVHFWIAASRRAEMMSSVLMLAHIKVKKGIWFSCAA